MTLRLMLAALLALGVFGCGEKPPEEKPPETSKEQNCVDGADDDGDGFIDCDDNDCNTDASCKPPEPKPCTAQVDCGNIVDEIVTKVCLEKKCVAPGQSDRKGEPVQVTVTLRMNFDSSFQTFATPPRSAVLRFVMPQTTDGKTMTCDELETSRSSNWDAASARWNATQADRSKLDNDRTVNQVYRQLITLNWGSVSGAQTIPVPGLKIPRGKPLMLYGEVWYGDRDLNNPTGLRLTTKCIDGVDLAAATDGQEFPIDFHYYQ